MRDPPEEFQVEDILKASGISKGSLYHHFADSRDLIDQALVLSFTQGVDEHITLIEQVLGAVNSKHEAARAFRAITLESQQSVHRSRRTLRMSLIVRAETDNDLAAKLEAEQERMTSTLELQIIRMQDNGWLSRDFDARAGAVFIQAYTLGRRLDQLSEDTVSENAWNTLIFRVIEQGLMASPNQA